MGNVESPQKTVAFFGTAFRAEKPTDPGTTVAPTSWNIGTFRVVLPYCRTYVNGTAGEKSTLPYPGSTDWTVSFRVPGSRICGRNAARPTAMPVVRRHRPPNSPAAPPSLG